MKNKKLYPWIVVGLLWVVALLNYMDRQMLSTMKSAMMVDIVELESAADSVTRAIWTFDGSLPLDLRIHEPCSRYGGRQGKQEVANRG